MNLAFVSCFHGAIFYCSAQVTGDSQVLFGGANLVFLTEDLKKHPQAPWKGAEGMEKLSDSTGVHWITALTTNHILL